MTKRWIAVVLCTVLPCMTVFPAGTNNAASRESRDAAAQAPALLSFHLTPGIDIPLGPNAQYYAVGGSLDLSGEYRIRALPFVFLQGGLGYAMDPLMAGPSVSTLSVSVGAGVRFDPVPWLAVRAYGTVGEYFGFLSSDGDTTFQSEPLLSAGAKATFSITPSIGIGIGASYNLALNLSSRLVASLGASYTLGAETKRPPRLNIGEVRLVNVFPVLSSYYDINPVGQLVLKNQEKEDLTNIKVTLFVKDYMSAPKECQTPSRLRPGESRTVDLFALFKENVLDITEGIKTLAEISVTCEWKGTSHAQSKVETLRMYNRNALTWDDTRKAAAFVTSKDPVILTFAKNVSGILKGKTFSEIDPNVYTAIGLHEALDIYGLSYSIDPSSSYAESSKKKADLDFCQFPRQTLDYKGGDCDDLSILYCALLESVGIGTAFITVPGHIFMAFALSVAPEDVAASLLSPGDLVLANGKVWMPIEVTMRQAGFLKAWQAGAREWREYTGKGEAELLPVREAWSAFEPVGFPSVGANVAVPTSSRVAEACAASLTSLLDAEIQPRIAEVQALLNRNPTDSRSVNKLGVLYAKYGFAEKAAATFRGILAREEFMPALMNLGHLSFKQGDMRKAIDLYTRASVRDPKSASAVLGIARASQGLELYGDARARYQELLALNPELAAKHAYLGEQSRSDTRASDIIDLRGSVAWEEQ